MWKDLTLKEKAEIMKMSVANGVTDINDIKAIYDNETHSYQLGGHLFKDGGRPNWSHDPASMIEHFEGFRESPYRDGTAWSVGYGQYMKGYGANLDWNALLSGRKKLSRSEAHQQVLRTVEDLKKQLRKALGDKLYNSLTPGQLMGYLDTGYQRPASMIQAAQVHRTKGAEAAASALGVNGFADRNAARRAAFTGNWNNYKPTGNTNQHMPNMSTGADYNRQMLNILESPAFQPIALNSPNTSSAWMDYISKIGQQSPIAFNTPIRATNTRQNNVGINLTPTDFSVLSGNGDLMSPLEPYAAKQAIEYGLGLENNALWNSPYLMFEHESANGGHLFRGGSRMRKLKDFQLSYPEIKIDKNAIKRKQIKLKRKLNKELTEAEKAIKKEVNEDIAVTDALAGAALYKISGKQDYLDHALTRLKEALGIGYDSGEYATYKPITFNPDVLIKSKSQLANADDVKKANQEYLENLPKEQLKELQQVLSAKGLLDKKQVDGVYGKNTLDAYNKLTVNEERWNNDVSTEGIDNCAQWVTLKYENATGASSVQNGVFSNAWNMLGEIENHGGSIIYNVYDDSFNGKFTHSELNRKTEKAIKANKLDYSQLQIGDVVGIYIPSSNAWKTALEDGQTKNTHVGIITGFNKNGVPIVEHNIHGSHKRDLITNISGSAVGKAMVSAVARPAYSGSQVSQLHWDPKKSIYTVDEQYSNAQLEEYMNSMAGISEQIQKLYPNVNMEDAQLAALSVLKRETNFMNNKTSDQDVVSTAKEYVGNIARSMKGMTDDTKSSNLSKIKLSTLTPTEKQLLGIHTSLDLEDPKKAGAAALMIMTRNMDYLNRLSEQYPDLGITADDIYNASVLSYNQGMNKLATLGFDKKGAAPQELEILRMLSDPASRIKDVNSTKYKYLGSIGEYLYDQLEEPYVPYIAAANDAVSKYIRRNGEQIPTRASVNLDNNDYINRVQNTDIENLLAPQLQNIVIPSLQDLRGLNLNFGYGGHLFGDGSMLLKDNAVNPALQYVYGPDYERIVREKRNYRPTGNIRRSRPVYDIKQQADVVANTTRPTQRKIKIAQEVESPARRKKEEEKATNRHLQYIRERQGSIQPQPNTLHHPDYNPKFAQEVEELRRKEAKEALERAPVDNFIGSVLEGTEAIPWPSRIVGSLTHPNTHWYDPFSFLSNLYANDNRGFFNFNQATRDFYDANPEVGGVANLIGDFIAPGAVSKVLKGASRASKFAAADISNSWKTMRYELAHPEAQTLGIMPDGFNVSKLNNKLKNFGNKLDDTILKIGNAEMQVVDNIKHGVSGIRDRIHNIVNRSERPILERVRDYGALSDTQLNSIPYVEALKYPDFVDYAFTHSGSLHPNFQAGSTRKDIIDAMANVERNLASRPRFATSEYLGQDFSGQSVQMILNRIDKLQKQLIKSGEQPGIIRYTPDARTYLNPYAEINYGTKEAPTNPFTTILSSGNYQLPYTRLDQEYTIEDMSKWSDIQATLDAITKRLQRIYDNVNPYNEAVRNAGRDAFKAEVLPDGYITVPSIGFLFRNGGKL